jgi:hypothetical protein
MRDCVEEAVGIYIGGANIYEVQYILEACIDQNQCTPFAKTNKEA